HYQSYDATMIAETGKLNVNTLLNNPKGIEIFKKYLELRGLSQQERDAIVTSLLYWIKPLPAGAPPDPPDYQPPHKNLRSLDEIKDVRNLVPLVSKPGWSDDLTLWPPNGTIDLQWASAQVLESLSGAPSAS